MRAQKLTKNIELINFPNKRGFSPSQSLNINTTVEAGNAKLMRALDVSKYSIQYLYTRALEVIKERTGDEDF